METIVCQRVAFAESAATGQIAQEIDPNSTAAQEINALVNLIENL
ncbi:MAG TPA: hypothetical protein VES89_09440 [Candidatus Competibacteraceae bacterium]|nr:hypothetical protein [Candidatus Competibacteraceae bacterium]